MSRYQLVQTDTQLELHDTLDARLKPVFIDFVGGKARHRLLFGGGKGQDLAKAIGLHKHKLVHVLDATAGLGRDAFVLASLGCTVTLLERSAMLHALLADGLKRAAQSEDEMLVAIIARMHLYQADARQWLTAKPIQPDMVYLDPMFPLRQKSALVQKEMRFLHEIVGDDSDDAELLPLARAVAKHRVVVKRPRLAPCLADTKPAFSISGKAIRYDVYLPLPQTAAQENN